MEKKLRTCLQDLIPEIYDAARSLDAALSAHLVGMFHLAEELIGRAYMPIVREWTESIWGSGELYTEFQKRPGEPDTVPKEERDTVCMLNKKGVKALLERDGYHCRFCGIPVI